MKFEWLREKEKMIPCKIVHKGRVRDLLLHHLTAADIDEADRKFPVVKPPPLLGDDDKPLRDDKGMPRLDEADLDYINRSIEQRMNFASFIAVMALGPEAFEARDIDEQIKELRRSGEGFSRMAILAIRDAALSDAVLTPAMLEAAKDSVRPTESGV